MQFQAVLDLPKETLQGVLDDQLAKAKARQAQLAKERAEREKKWREEQARRRAAIDKARDDAARKATDQAGALKRIEQLERRLDKLEAQIDLLMKLLQRPKGGAEK